MNLDLFADKIVNSYIETLFFKGKVSIKVTESFELLKNDMIELIVFERIARKLRENYKINNLIIDKKTLSIEYDTSLNQNINEQEEELIQEYYYAKFKNEDNQEKFEKNFKEVNKKFFKPIKINKTELKEMSISEKVEALTDNSFVPFDFVNSLEKVEQDVLTNICKFKNVYILPAPEFTFSEKEQKNNIQGKSFDKLNDLMVFLEENKTKEIYLFSLNKVTKQLYTDSFKESFEQKYQIRFYVENFKL